MYSAIRILISILMCISLGSLTAEAQQRQRDFEEGLRGQLRSTGNRPSLKTMQRPMLGFVYASDLEETRVIYGIPGASVLSDPLTLSFEVANVSFAPGQKWAIVQRKDGASIGVLAFPGSDPGPFIEIPGGISNPDMVVFSASGSAAVVYSNSEGRLQVIGGLPAAPQLTREISLSDLPERVRLLAIADDGVTLLEGGARSGVYLLANDGTQPFLYGAGDLAAMAFASGSKDAIIFDRNGGSALLLQNPDSAPTTSSLVTGLITLDDNIALWADTGKAIITSAGTREVWQIDLQSLQLQKLQLAATPTMVVPLRISGSFLISYSSGEPGWILDTSGETPALHFVPAVPATTNNASSGASGRVPKPIRGSSQ